MTALDNHDFDVFVGAPATVGQVQRTIEYTLHSAPFDRGPTRARDGSGRATLGHHTLLHVGPHDLGDDLLHDRALPVPLATEFPVRVQLLPMHPYTVRFDIEAVARRLYTVLRAQAWPVALTYQLTDVFCLHRPLAQRI